MSISQILEISESVGINDQRFVGQTLSRNQKIFTSEIITVTPFIFTMQPMNYLLYSKNRGLLNSLRIPDKALEQYIQFRGTGWESYIEYQGDMTQLEIEATEWQTSSAAKTLVLGNLPSMGSNEFIVKAGDFCQVQRYSYIATADVRRGTGTTVSIPVHRGLMTPLLTPVGAVIGQYGATVSMGGTTYEGCTFPVILQQYPSYTLIPYTNDSYIQWSGSFVAFESVL